MNLRTALMMAFFSLWLTIADGSRAQAALEAGFAHPPREARPLVWWHWVSGNMSKEGIRADLEDMKRAGIGGVQMFDVDLYLPHGPVVYGTDTWHEHVQYAMRVAHELGLEFMTMNCAGWSQSAGPWVTPEKSMKVLVWSETTIEGDKPCHVDLPQPSARLDYYRDIAVMAVPADPAETAAQPVVTSESAGLNTAALTDGKPTTEVSFPDAERPVSFTFTYPAPTCRSQLTIGLPRINSRLTLKGQLQAAEDGKKFRPIRNINEDVESRAKAVTVAFAPTSARAFRVVLRGEAAQPATPLRLSELGLSGIYRVEDLPTKIGVKKPDPERLDPTWAAADPLAIPLNRVIDLTQSVSEGGRLSWQAPAGRWTILRLGFTTTGSKNHPAIEPGHGLEVDKFDAAAVEFHFEHGLGRILREAGPLTGKAFTGILFDSWEAGSQNWTAKLPEMFQQRRGYDLRPLLPCLAGRVLGSRGQTEAFLADFRKTLGELYASEHYGTIVRLAHQRGLKVYAEAYGGCLDEASAAEAVDVPMAEFWMHMQSHSCQRVTSLAHTTGKKVVAAESFTARPPDGRWREVPATLKPVGDAAFIEGINRMCLHTYVQQPRLDLAPGFSSGRYGTHFGRLNSWWVYAPAWVEYLARSQYLLQYGQSVNDLLYLRHEGLETSGMGDYPATPPGYGADLIAVRQLLQAKAESGRLRLACGTAYRVLVLPGKWAANLATLRKIEGLVAAGIPVLGPPPTCPSGLLEVREHAAAWKALVAKLWGKGTAGTVHPCQDLPAVLNAAAHGPDFHFRGEGPDTDIRFLHRGGEGTDIYFLSNQEARPVTIEADFRMDDRRPELWDAATGKIVPATSYRVEGGRVVLPLSLEKDGSIFVVFRQPLPQNWVVAIKKDGSAVLPNAPDSEARGNALVSEPGKYEIQYQDGRRHQTTLAVLPKPLKIEGPWRLAFQPGRGAPEGEITLDRLASLSEHLVPGVRHFSGVTTYQTTFELSTTPAADNLECVLELGEVNNIAEVKVNGQPCGIQWKAPFAVVVTPWLRAGKNDLTIAVANTWVNRLIGDEELPIDAEYETKGSIFTVGRLAKFPVWWNDPAAVKARQRTTFTVWRHYEKSDPLVASGLVGPVRLRFARMLPVGR